MRSSIGDYRLAREQGVTAIMRLDELPTSNRIEDRRGLTASRAGGLGVGTIVVLGLIGWALGIDPRLLIGGAEMMSRSDQTQQETQVGTGTPSDETGRFVSAILGSTETEWKEAFDQAGKNYQPPTLVMFSGATQSGCGFARAAMGPFYCPIDQKVYLDTSFFQDLERRFRGCDAGSKTCQFSQAYVIAHEIGHHVQNLLGVEDKVRQMKRARPELANQLSVRMELQADCLAGVWGHSTEQRNILEAGDVDKAINAASAIGDDRLQRMGGGTVNPDSFTHGSSADRVKWFQTGFSSGDVAACNTFEQ